MDYIREFDIRLDKEMFYAGEILEGHVVLDTIENFKLKSKFHGNIRLTKKKMIVNCRRCGLFLILNANAVNACCICEKFSSDAIIAYN